MGPDAQPVRAEADLIDPVNECHDRQAVVALAGLRWAVLLVSASCIAGCASRPGVSGCLDGNAALTWPSAHRGDQHSGPENSKASLDGAGRAGLPLVEIDLQRAGDGRIYLFHDETIDPAVVTGAPEGSRFDALEGAGVAALRYVGSAQPVLSLDQALAIVRRWAYALQLDFKPGSQDLVEDALERFAVYGLIDRAIVQCGSRDCLRHTARSYPAVRRLARAHDPDQAADWLAEEPDILQVDLEWLTADLVRLARRNGVRVLIKSLWEDDHPKGWQARLDAGADIVLTDHAGHFADRHRPAGPCALPIWRD